MDFVDNKEYVVYCQPCLFKLAHFNPTLPLHDVWIYMYSILAVTVFLPE